MVTTTAAYTQSRYRASPGEGFDGVVRVSQGGLSASGALLFDGRAVLTAAHLFDVLSGSASVTFETRAGIQTVTATRWQIHPGWDEQGNNDLALVWLAQSAPLAATRYGLYREQDEIGRTFTMVGYGQMGTGATGATVRQDNPAVRLRADNRFDAEAAELKAVLGSGMAWTPAAGSLLVADFDNGSAANDALGLLMGRPDAGVGLDEGLIARGDSGGPAFISGLVAGVASYTASLSQGSVQPDVDDQANSSFGEVAVWQRVSAHQRWIDQSLRAAYPDAPARPEDVRKSVPEGDSGMSYVYFLLQFSGVRSHPDAVVSVEYATRDGTALAGSDYVAASGVLQLYPGETHAVVAVEVIGDTVSEPDEHFYLDVFNPIGGSFGPGVVMLTAMRTIVNDDVPWG